jgi:PAS domain S-box-containing protein
MAVRGMDDFEQLFAVASDPLGIASLDGVLLVLNPAWETVLGYPLDELQGRCLLDLVVDEDRERTAAELARLRQGQPTVFFDNRLRHRDGTYRWMRWSIVPRVEEDRLFAVAREATELSEARLRGEHLADIVRSSSDAIIGKTLDGVITSWNRGAEELYGYPAEEVVGRPISILAAPGAEDEVPSLLARIRRGERVENYETVRRTRDGREVEVSLTLSPVRDAGGRLRGASAITRDVTLRKRALATEELRQATAQLEAANRELEAFSYSVSHDLRAPLRAMDGFSQALLEDYRERLDPQGQDYLGRIRAAAQRMGRLIDDLLELSRVGRATLRQGPVEMAPLAAAILDRLRAAEPDREVETRVAAGLGCRADRRLLEVILTNLLGNAWKFTKTTSAARIELGAEARDGQRVFFVRDNGTGFDMRYADQLFRPFSRLHPAADFPGTGIGLAIVQRAVQRLDGRVWAEGREGDGATFYFTLGGS